MKATTLHAEIYYPFFKCAENNQITEIQVRQFVKTICGNVLLAESYQRKILSILKTALREILKGSDQYQRYYGSVKLPKVEITAVQAFSVKEQRLY